MKFETIIWDLGGVLIDWNPKYVFSDAYFGSAEKSKYFFENICTSDWNEEQDAGRSIVEGTQALITVYPEWEQQIRDYYGRWTDMLGGPISETVTIFKNLKESKRYKQYALTNWQANLFDIALVRYNFLQWFDGRVVSGEEKTRKPFPEFYHRLLERYDVNPATALFIDDNLRNVNAAESLGIRSIHFTSPSQLLSALQSNGVL